MFLRKEWRSSGGGGEVVPGCGRKKPHTKQAVTATSRGRQVQQLNIHTITFISIDCSNRSSQSSWKLEFLSMFGSGSVWVCVNRDCKPRQNLKLIFLNVIVHLLDLLFRIPVNIIFLFLCSIFLHFVLFATVSSPFYMRSCSEHQTVLARFHQRAPEQAMKLQHGANPCIGSNVATSTYFYVGSVEIIKKKINNCHKFALSFIYVFFKR